MSKNMSAANGSKPIQISLYWSAPVDLDLCVFYRDNEGREGGVFSDEFRQDSNDLGSLDRYPYMLHHGDEGEPLPGKRGVETVEIARPEDFDRIDIVAINYDDAVDLLDIDYSDDNGGCLIRLPEKDHIIASQPDCDGHAYHIATLRSRADGSVQVEEVNSVISLRRAYDSIPGFRLICEA